MTAKLERVDSTAMKQLFLIPLLTALLAPSAFLQKQQTDREIKNLKGNVKSVEAAISPVDKKTRQRTSREEFDAAGNLTVETGYDQFGDALAVLTYSYLDGERVVKEESKNSRPISPRNRPIRPAALRYTAKLKYKYDSDGNRIETTHIFADDSPPTKQVYAFSANERQELIYSATGSLTFKFVHKLDDKGNEVETITTRYEGVKDPLQATTNYKYLEFDSQGNWTRRMESRGGESWMIYRTITYH